VQIQGKINPLVRNLFLDLNANVRDIELGSFTPYSGKYVGYAIEKGNLVYAQKILSQNFDPNLVAENGYTPLMYAAARGDTRMVELLLRNGANVNLVSRDGDTAIELALRIGSQECADVLKKARLEQQARERAVPAAQGSQA